MQTNSLSNNNLQKASNFLHVPQFEVDEYRAKYLSRFLFEIIIGFIYYFNLKVMFMRCFNAENDKPCVYIILGFFSCKLGL